MEGRHRFACAIVVPENFDGKLQWQVKFAGKTATTTEKVLNPLYELEANSERRLMTGLDLKTAPRGSCVNRTPIVQLIAPGADASIADVHSVIHGPVGVAAGSERRGSGRRPAERRQAGDYVEEDRRSGKRRIFQHRHRGNTRDVLCVQASTQLELTGNDGEKSGAVKVRVSVAAGMPTGGG